ncbi:hypothetical protein F7725_014219, partial [Dissostichus mawsoni]
TGSDWCYTNCDDTPSTWKYLHGASCGGKRQSPIDIDTNNVHADPHLLNFNFVNFSSKHVIKSIINNGHTGTQTETEGVFYTPLSVWDRGLEFLHDL